MINFIETRISWFKQIKLKSLKLSSVSSIYNMPRCNINNQFLSNFPLSGLLDKWIDDEWIMVLDFFAVYSNFIAFKGREPNSNEL